MEILRPLVSKASGERARRSQSAQDASAYIRTTMGAEYELRRMPPAERERFDRQRELVREQYFARQEGQPPPYGKSASDIMQEWYDAGDEDLARLEEAAAPFTGDELAILRGYRAIVDGLDMIRKMRSWRESKSLMDSVLEESTMSDAELRARDEERDRSFGAEILRSRGD